MTGERERKGMIGMREGDKERDNEEKEGGRDKGGIG